MSVSILAFPAFADDIADAAALFKRGLEHMEAGRYEMGCPSLEESYKLDPRPGSLFTLAECEAKRGRSATAVARYDEYLALFASLPPDKRAKQGDRETIAKTQRAALELDAPKLTLVLPPGAPQGTIVKRDGKEIPAEEFGAAISIDPGEHFVTTQAPGGPVTEVRISIGKREKRSVTLEVKAAPEARPSGPSAPVVSVSPAPRVEPEGQNKIPIIVGAAGAAIGIGLGAAFTVIANGAASDADDGTPPGDSSACLNPANATQCSDLKSSLEKSDTFSNLAMGSFIAGGVLAIGTVAYVLFAPQGMLTTPTTTGRPGAPGPVTVSATPVMGADGGGLFLKGTW